MHTLYRKVEVNCCGNLVNLWVDFRYCSQKQQSTGNTRLVFICSQSARNALPSVMQQMLLGPWTTWCNYLFQPKLVIKVSHISNMHPNSELKICNMGNILYTAG